ncbi:hypothetical protein [Staphylococcus canis]|uniref:Uncharacterized protein n=1 Tax=Staphylococcus canis TaxID=2724942 RepID=A0ABS0T6T5_9STAP|nr:hypothetical protein [Staphylococcus canis]MBI5974462.1 hypothetical protein [Staphylococcus canis]
MNQLFKGAAYVAGGALVLVLAGVGYLTFQQYQADESLVNEDFGKGS